MSINKKIHIPAIDITPVIPGSSIANFQYPQLNEPLNDRLRVGARKTGPVHNDLAGNYRSLKQLVQNQPVTGGRSRTLLADLGHILVTELIGPFKDLDELLRDRYYSVEEEVRPALYVAVVVVVELLVVELPTTPEGRRQKE